MTSRSIGTDALQHDPRLRSSSGTVTFAISQDPVGQVFDSPSSQLKDVRRRRHAAPDRHHPAARDHEGQRGHCHP
ncbi:MAG: hypothetical protein WKG07_36100 [Hymenobacter sp.]